MGHFIINLLCRSGHSLPRADHCELVVYSPRVCYLCLAVLRDPSTPLALQDQKQNAMVARYIPCKCIILRRPLKLSINAHRCQKQSDNFNDFLQAKIATYLMDKYWSEQNQQHSFKYYVNSFSILKILPKVF